MHTLEKENAKQFDLHDEDIMNTILQINFTIN